MQEIADAIERAWDARQALHEDPQTNAYRLFHGYSEGCPGLEIDRYGESVALMSKGPPRELVDAALECLRPRIEGAKFYVKLRGQAAVAVDGRTGQAVEVLEAGLRYRVEPWLPRNPGLYLDAREARAWLRESSAGRRVLNLFSFAGSLGVAAMAGGASAVTHVDGQKNALRRCAANHAANQQRIDGRDLVCMDVVRYLRSSAAKERSFAGVIIDAPPIPNAQREARKGLTAVELSAQASALLVDDGWLLCFFHHDPRSWDELEAAVVAQSTGLVPVWRGQAGADFPEDDLRRSLRLSAFRRGA